MAALRRAAWLLALGLAAAQCHQKYEVNHVPNCLGDNAQEPIPDWISGALYERLLAVANAGHGRRHVVHANEPEAVDAVGQQTGLGICLQTRRELGGLHNSVPDAKDDGDDTAPCARNCKPEPELPML